MCLGNIENDLVYKGSRRSFASKNVETPSQHLGEVGTSSLSTRKDISEDDLEIEVLFQNYFL